MATETFLVNEDPSRGPGMPECFVVSDSYRGHLRMQSQGSCMVTPAASDRSPKAALIKLLYLQMVRFDVTPLACGGAVQAAGLINPEASGVSSKTSALLPHNDFTPTKPPHPGTDSRILRSPPDFPLMHTPSPATSAQNLALGIDVHVCVYERKTGSLSVNV
ncbi:hypothetical protein MHYP_G00155820 [Metynnis hypsauchen]